jgi:putative PIN family toxin of toxin-antitoxin system
MIVCIDTNTVVQALAQHHPFHPILDAWVAGHLTWAVSTPVLLEYEEVLTRLSGPSRWRKLARLMDLAELTSGNLLRVTPSFQFRVVTADPDDNSFTDCAITADAEYLLTEDSHFAPLAAAGYKPRPLSPQQFIVQFLAGGRATTS